MTPLHLKILIHYYACPDSYRGGESGHIVKEFSEELVQKGLLDKRQVAGDIHYEYTSNLATECYIEHILQTPIPIQKWVIPGV